MKINQLQRYQNTIIGKISGKEKEGKEVVKDLIFHLFLAFYAGTHFLYSHLVGKLSTFTVISSQKFLKNFRLRSLNEINIHWLGKSDVFLLSEKNESKVQIFSSLLLFVVNCFSKVILIHCLFQNIKTPGFWLRKGWLGEHFGKSAYTCWYHINTLQ